MGVSHEKEDIAIKDIEPRPIKPILGAALVVLAALTFWEVVEWINDEPRLTPKRQGELKKQIEEFEDAEQYALKTEMPGWYDCYYCPSGKILLTAFSVWKYGVYSAAAIPPFFLCTFPAAMRNAQVFFYQALAMIWVFKSTTSCPF